MAQHDLIFFEKRSTPKVVSKGQKFTAPASYGKQTRRRPATAAEEKQISNGQWVRVDQSGKKGGQPGYKKTRMKGREHLVKHADEDDEKFLSHGEIFVEGIKNTLKHYGKKGMKWGVRNEDRPTGGDRSGSKPKETDDATLNSAYDGVFKKGDKSLQDEGANKLKDQADKGDFPPSSRQLRGQKKAEQAAELGERAQQIRKDLDDAAGNTGLGAKFQRQQMRNDINFLETNADKLSDQAERMEAGKLTSNQKKALIVGGLATTAVLGAIATDQYMRKKWGVSPEILEAHKSDTKRESEELWAKMFKMDPEFTSAKSPGSYEGGAFYEGLTNKKAMLRPEFEIPEGTVFQRLSNHQEDSSEYGHAVHNLVRNYA